MTYTPHPALQKRPRELCQLMRDYAGKLPAPDGVIVEEKVDGIRCLYIDGQLMTRNGDPIEGAEHIKVALRAIERETCRPMFFDGEWQVDGSFDATLDHFSTRGRNGDQGIFWLFDMLDMEEWRGNCPGNALLARKRKIDALPKNLTLGAVQVLPWHYFETAADVEAFAQDMISGGGEGVVIKDPKAVYRRERTGAWQRIKRSELVTGKVIAALPQAKCPDRLGTLLIDLDGTHIRVTAGLSDREGLWRAGVVGRTATIKMMERTASGQARQARFVAWN